MAKDYPFGGGASAFIYYSDFYIPQNIDTGSSRNRAVHSTWFEVLTEIGYLGLLSFSLMIFYCFLTLKKAANHLRDTGDSDELAKVMAVIGGFLCLIVIMTFLNRFRAEILYWFVIFSGVAYNINYLSLLKGNTYESSS